MVWAMHDPANFAKEVIAPPPIAEDRFAEAIRLVVSNGWPFRLHANYDVTAARLVGVLEKVHRDVPIDKVRWAIDHAETISPQTLERVAKLGGSIAIQNRMSLDGEPFIAKWGAEAAQDAPPVKRIRDMGIHLASGTDGNRASSHNPWVGVQWLITGKTQGGLKHQADHNLLDRAEALRLYSAAGAWLTREDDRKGTLTAGKFADLAVLSADYMSIPVEQISSLSSVLTIVGGKIVHGAGPFVALAAPMPKPSQDWLPVGSYPSWQAADLQGDSRRLAASVLSDAATPPIVGNDGTLWETGCLCGVL
jgi:predicted amidohydrolase YtcJ